MRKHESCKNTRSTPEELATSQAGFCSLPMPIPHFLRCALLLPLLATAFASHASQSALWKAHQSDTVEWRHWRAELLENAKTEDKPLFFFVAHYGNSLARAMLTETFQNKTIAATLNESTLPVLVDINEQAELAAFLRSLASQRFDAGELPICIWTDSELTPLNGGGYFPPTDDWGGQGFLSLARNVDDQWRNTREDFLIAAKSGPLTTPVRKAHSLSGLAATPDHFPLEALQATDAPTLPALALYNYASALDFLPNEKRVELCSVIDETLLHITSGAGFDSVSGGFFSGSNDAGWRLPLFQKSTSEQALMILALSKLSECNPKTEYIDLIKLTAHFIESELNNDQGNSIQYLDSFAPGESLDTTEGSYYLVSGDGVTSLSPESIKTWGLDENGNLTDDIDILGLYKDLNVPYTHSRAALSTKSSQLRKELQELRQNKPRPLSDNTGYTATNALIIEAFIAASKATDQKSYLDEAEKRFNRLLATNFDRNSSTLYNSDSRSLPANSLDYSYLISASLKLQNATEKKKYRKTAKSILKAWKEDDRFPAPNLLNRPSGNDGIWFASYADGAIPSAASVQIRNLITLEGSDSDSIDAILSDVPASIEDSPERFRSLFIACSHAVDSKKN